MKPVHCAAVIAIEYTQRDTVVGIAGTISIGDCAACSGEYEIRVSVRNGSGSVETLKYVETWERHDDQPIAFSGQYSIGQNLEVVRTRAVQLRCTCAASDERGE
jgi:hypothetical protein